MSWDARSLRASLIVYLFIVLLYAVLVGWWVYFFSEQDVRLGAEVRRAGAVLDPVQQEALRVAAHRHMRMFLSEGIFLGLLLVASIYVVLRAMKEEAFLYRQQHNFLAAVTHELNSPIASARLALEAVLAKRTEPVKTERYLRNAQEDLKRLSQMVADLLDTGRLASRRPELDPEVLDLAAMAHARAKRFLGAVGSEHTHIETQAASKVMVNADEGAMEKVIDNLVANAIKYGGEQPVVQVRVHSEGSWAVLEVRDHGPGLQGADPVKVLRPFVRGRDENVRIRPGAGLGLYIVDEFVRAHGGDVEIADGLEGGGTRVRVRLPLAAGKRAVSGPAVTEEA
jgi:signal transduction histidine kinase